MMTPPMLRFPTLLRERVDAGITLRSKGNLLAFQRRLMNLSPQILRNEQCQNDCHQREGCIAKHARTGKSYCLTIEINGIT